MKHLKLKNTSILFEVLCYKSIEEFRGNKDTAIKILSKRFGPKSELLKDYLFYNAVFESDVKDRNMANSFIDTIVNKRRASINEDKLKKEQISLVGEINTVYGKDAFKIYVPKYKLMASLKQIFDVYSAEVSNISESINIRNTILDYIITNDKTIPTDRLTRVLLETKYIEKYGNLLPEQTDVLNRVVACELPEKIISDHQKKLLDSYKEIKISNGSYQIKINEVISKINTKLSKPVDLDDSLTFILHCYETLGKVRLNIEEINKMEDVK